MLHCQAFIEVHIYIQLASAFATDKYLKGHLLQGLPQLQYNKQFFSLSIRFFDFR